MLIFYSLLNIVWATEFYSFKDSFNAIHGINIQRLSEYIEEQDDLFEKCDKLFEDKMRLCGQTVILKNKKEVFIHSIKKNEYVKEKEFFGPVRTKIKEFIKSDPLSELATDSLNSGGGETFLTKLINDIYAKIKEYEDSKQLNKNPEIEKSILDLLNSERDAYNVFWLSKGTSTL